MNPSMPQNQPNALPARHALRTSWFAALTLAATLAAPLAHADWAVKDDQLHKDMTEGDDSTNGQLKNANKVLGKPNATATGTINGNLDYLNKRFNVPDKGTLPQEWPGKRVDDPKDAAWKDALGSTSSQCDGYAQGQQPTCNQIVDTRNAYYKFMKSMYEMSKTRNDMLKTLTDARKNINPNEFGKLTDNTNQITALYTQIAIDRQQMESLEHGYRMRIDYLNQLLTQKAKNATSGKGSGAGDSSNKDGPNTTLSDLGSSAVAGLVLKLALDQASHHSAVSDDQRLSIDKNKN